MGRGWFGTSSCHASQRSRASGLQDAVLRSLSLGMRSRNIGALARGDGGVRGPSVQWLPFASTCMMICIKVHGSSGKEIVDSRLTDCPHSGYPSVRIHLRESNSTQEARLGLQPVSSSWSPMVRDFPALAHSVRGCPNLFDQPLYLKEDPFAFFLGEPLVGVFRFISLVPQIVKIAQQGLP